MESKAPVRRQIVSTVLGNLLTGSLGATNGWASVNFVDLQKDDTSFPSGPLSLEQATLVVSICYAGAIIGNSVFPFVVKKYGSKRTLLAAVFPQIIKHYGVTGYISLQLLFLFIINSIYPPIKIYIGLLGWISIFAVTSFCNALYGIFVLPETRGISNEAIMQLLDK